MNDSEIETESKLWADTDERQKSYVVQMLHWFHYRPTRLRESWKQEEVLTWELLRALDVLPQTLFLRPLLKRIATLGDEASKVVDSLGAGRICVYPYPSLEMSGSKRNCKSDIGLGTGSKPAIWIEAKTASFRASDLEAQLRQQASAMASIMPGMPRLLVTLLPTRRALSTFPNLSWDDVLDVLRSFGNDLATAIPDLDYSYGYALLAAELADRIESHPNRSKGWV